MVSLLPNCVILPRLNGVNVTALTLDLTKQSLFEQLLQGGTIGPSLLAFGNELYKCLFKPLQIADLVANIRDMAL